MGKVLKLSGQKFGRLMVIRQSELRTNAGKVQWICKCDCGNIVTVIGSKLVNGWSKSCSCIQKEFASNIRKVTVKKADIPEYHVWASMKARCTYPKYASYSRYGGRGITVCDRWLSSFENFIDDMGRRPNADYSLDRIDNDKGYCKENCRWATRITQENNKSTNVKLQILGEYYSLAQLSRMTGMSYSYLWRRKTKNSLVIELEKLIAIKRMYSIDLTTI